MSRNIGVGSVEANRILRDDYIKYYKGYSNKRKV